MAPLCSISTEPYYSVVLLSAEDYSDAAMCTLNVLGFRQSEIFVVVVVVQFVHCRALPPLRQYRVERAEMKI